ncbi:alpha/beta hydrolase [Brevundimonas sp.]|jgi:acetyl esterase/lipase|uniref:alpha/beta hydrolase n=1 Tax=Brevundimonas sp. TaxID=1871086 RepID=UPI0037833453
MKIASLIVALVVASPLGAIAQDGPPVTMTREAGPDQATAIKLYPAGSTPAGPAPETWAHIQGQAGPGITLDMHIVRNVSEPTVTPFLPDPAKATGAAVVVAPGGAFLSLTMDAEGEDVARWFADHGIAAFVLKYRLNPTPENDGAFLGMMSERMGAAIQAGDARDVNEPRAAEDGARALTLIRERAAEWGIDPERVGFIGFSAGAMTGLQTVMAASPQDQPAFLAYVYGPMLAVQPPAGAPPLFVAIALDDPLFGRQGFGLVDAWRTAGAAVELHAFERGGHGFGMGVAGTTTASVMDDLLSWLAMRGLLMGSER